MLVAVEVWADVVKITMFRYSVLSLVTEKEDCNINWKVIVHVFLPLQSTEVGSKNLNSKH